MLTRAALVTSSHSKGMLWNMPNFGGMNMSSSVLAGNVTEWVAHDPVNNQVDVFVTTYELHMHSVPR